MIQATTTTTTTIINEIKFQGMKYATYKRSQGAANKMNILETKLWLLPEVVI